MSCQSGDDGLDSWGSGEDSDTGNLGYLDTPPHSMISTPNKREGKGAHTDRRTRGERLPKGRGAEWDEPVELHAVLFDRIHVVDDYCASILM